MFSGKPRQERSLTATLEPLMRDRPIIRKAILGTGFALSGAMASFGFGVAVASDYATVYETFNLVSQGIGFSGVVMETAAVLGLIGGLEMTYYNRDGIRNLNRLRRKLVEYDRMQVARKRHEAIWGGAPSSYEVKSKEEQIPDFLRRTLAASKRGAVETRNHERQRPEE